MKLPKDHRPYIDKYFLRAKEILQKDGLNPPVVYQVFIRRGECKVYGLNEAANLIKTYAPNVSIYSMKDGDYINNNQVVMTLQGPVQDLIDLETMYLGIISAETTIKNDTDINLKTIKHNMEQVVEAAAGRPVMYFGARHWHYNRDAEISKACFKAGATDCSTDIGAKTAGKKGVGTIPHALEAIYHWRYGLNRAVMCSITAFDKYMDSSIPRIALVDYANREILDSLSVAKFFLSIDQEVAIRIDTCGENVMQGIIPNETKGVSVPGVYAVRKILNDEGCHKVKIVLSSGFANPMKIKKFLFWEPLLKTKLFDSLGVGQVYESRCATSDIIVVDGVQTHKVGRGPKPVLRRVL